MKTGILFFVKVFLALLVIIYLILYIEIDAILSAAESARLGWIISAIVLLPLNVLFSGLAWLIMLRIVIPHASFKEAYGSLFSGFALGLFTPGRVGQYAGRSFYFDYPDKWELTGLVIAQQFYGLVIGITVGSSAWWYARNAGLFTLSPYDEIFVFIGLTLAFILLMVVLIPQKMHRLVHAAIPFQGFRARLAFLQRLSPARSVLLLIIACGEYLIYTTQFNLALSAFSDASSFPATYLGIFTLYLIKYFIPPITWTDLGIREGIAVFVLGKIGFPNAAAFNASVVIYFTNLVLPAVIGIPFIFRMRLKRKAERDV